jgi:chromosomal replication initiation ATPase DnaA
MSSQLVFELGHRIAREREDFLVTPSNEAAVALIDAWPVWPGASVAFSGPRGGGKTHLAEVWREMSGATRIKASDLASIDVFDLVSTRAIIVEDISVLFDAAERTLFHLLNFAQEAGASLLLTAREAPGYLSIRLPDLASRLRALPHAEIGPPDDTLLTGVLVKLFDDRQLRVSEPLIVYLVNHIERSIAIAHDVVAALDRASLLGKRAVTIPLAIQVLEELNIARRSLPRRK